MKNMNRRGATFGTTVATIGSILIALGIIWLIAQNWHQMLSPVKILILLLATCGAYFSGTFLRVKDYKGIGNSLIVLGSLLYTWSIFLIAQIFSTRATAQGTAWLFLISWLGVFIFAYIFQSPVSLQLALIEFVIWIINQYIAFLEYARALVSPGILAFYFLFTGILLYGLSLWHRSNEHAFAKLYQMWSVFYFLAFTYVLSFQVLLPYLWPEKSVSFMPSILFLFFIGVVSIAVLITGIVFSLDRKSADKREILGMIGTMLILAILIGITAFTVEYNSWSLFGGRAESAPLINWAIWIIINISFILLILAVIGYGTWMKLPQIINLGIVFFSLDIITRYIGFMMNLWGYMSLSIVFISGGLLLVVGGGLIEKWRRNLVIKTRNT